MSERGEALIKRLDTWVKTGSGLVWVERERFFQNPGEHVSVIALHDASLCRLLCFFEHQQTPKNNKCT